MNKPNIGDYFVVHTTGIAARLIQLGNWSKWNHAGIYIGDDLIIEARPTGVSIDNIHKYDNKPILWSTGHDSPFTEAEGEELRTFALTFVGDSYGIWSIIALGIKSLTFGIPFLPVDWFAEHEDSVICSQLVAWVWSHLGRKVSKKKHALVRPKDLAERLSVREKPRSN
jgi:hypothetical protein